jgi:hypothetical protein
MTRAHGASAADWAASVTSVVGDGLDAVSARLGLTEPGALTRLGIRLAEQVRAVLAPPNGTRRTNGKQNGQGRVVSSVRSSEESRGRITEGPKRGSG